MDTGFNDPHVSAYSIVARTILEYKDLTEIQIVPCEYCSTILEEAFRNTHPELCEAIDRIVQSDTKWQSLLQKRRKAGKRQRKNRVRYAMTYTIDLTPQARRALDKLDRKTSETIISHIFDLRDRSVSLRPTVSIKKVEGTKSQILYRIRVGKCRAEYFVEGQIVYIIKIFMKKRKTDYR
jgi:mRNA-degrading endonuclease RelE of RelBE toxin-antitoxin system